MVSAAIIGFIGNDVVAIFRIRVGMQDGTAVQSADGQLSQVDGFTSLAVIIGAFGTLRGAPILDPIVGLAITGAILFIVRDAAKAVFLRLVDEVEHTPTHVFGRAGRARVRARRLGHEVVAELHIMVDLRLPADESHSMVEDVQTAMSGHVPAFGRATIHARPASDKGPSHRPAVALA